MKIETEEKKFKNLITYFAKSETKLPNNACSFCLFLDENLRNAECRNCSINSRFKIDIDKINDYFSSNI